MIQNRPETLSEAISYTLWGIWAELKHKHQIFTWIFMIICFIGVINLPSKDDDEDGSYTLFSWIISISLILTFLSYHMSSKNYWMQLNNKRNDDRNAIISRAQDSLSKAMTKEWSANGFDR